MEKLQEITFIALLEKLSKEQVAIWWESVTPDNVPKEAKKTNWKYFLEKDNKRIEFKWALYDLAKHYGYTFTTFNSDKGSRNAICERFDFDIYEKLVYDNSEKKAFLKLYNNKIQLKSVFQDFINYAGDILKNNSFNSYKTRMAIDTKNEALFIIGMRTVLSYREKDSKAIIGFVVSDDFANKTNLEKRYQYKGEPQQSYLEYTVSNWKELPENLLSENTIEIQKQYNSIKDTKRSTWNSEANTTNSVLKYLMFKKLNVEEWIVNYPKNNMEMIDIKDNNIYKISMGKFYKEDTIDGKDLYKIFEKDNIIVINRYTSNNQGSNFENILKVGDYVYLTYGQDRLGAIYKVKSENKELIKKYPNLKSLYSDQDIEDYIYRDVEVIKTPKITNTQSISNIKTSSFPSAYTTFKVVKELDKVNKLLFEPFYNIRIISNKTEKIRVTNINTMKHPLNQILYGPPGTGKTYETKELAVKIIDGEVPKTREKLSTRYKELIESKQILFTTFHQSMSYEDFVEGIKPKTIDDKDVVYNVEDGIFKQICKKAQEKETVNFLDAYYKMITNFRERDNEILDLKTPNGNVFSVNANSNDNLQLYTTANRNEQGSLTKERLEAFYKGDESVFLGWQSYANGVIKHLEDNYGLRKSAIQTNLNYVLIIDEINRGNVSAIFGELITLIEEDKRLGNDEALTITLPYSKKPFGVPKNLYIIGTMNTADRSVEALDTALRRRFNFTEMMPEYELLKLNTNLAIDLKLTLKTINKRIEILLDREHQIGHSYFLNIQTEADLLNAFQNKIIPLLQEYFYNDYDKIGLILGDSFIKREEDTINFATYSFKNNPKDYYQDRFSWVKLKTSTIIDAVNSITKNNE